jgi:ubiquinone/menaquinone biosynthesis C-methylase UbiE
VEPSAMSWKRELANCSNQSSGAKNADITNLLEVLALELRDDLLETVTLSVDADGGENGLDVGGGGGLVAGKGEEEVGSEVLHFEMTVPKKILVSIAS